MNLMGVHTDKDLLWAIFERAGGTLDHIQKMSRNKPLCRKVIALIDEEDCLSGKFVITNRITPGKYESWEDIEMRMRKTNTEIQSDARKLLEKLSFPSMQKKDYYFVTIAVRGLGFKKDVLYTEAVEEGVKQGWKKCSLHNSIDYIINKKDKKCTVLAMDLMDLEGRLHVLNAREGGGHMALHRDYFTKAKDKKIRPSDRLVFVKDID